VEYGLVISVVDRGLLWPERAAHTRYRKIGEAIMTFYIVGAVAAFLLMAYLVVALLKPELFS
jgi:K+-transporting ATPase KdpF subunit